MTISENTDLARSGIVLIAQGRFPKPVKIGRRASAWLMSEVEAWLDGKLSTRNVSTLR